MRQSCAVLGGGGVLCAVGRCGQAALRPMPSTLHYAAHAERPPAIAPRTPVHQRSDARRLPHCAVTPNCAHRAAHAPTCAAHTRSRSPSSIPRVGALVQSCRRTTPPAGACTHSFSRGLRGSDGKSGGGKAAVCPRCPCCNAPAFPHTHAATARHRTPFGPHAVQHCRALAPTMAITQHRSPTLRHYTELRCTTPSTTLHAAHGALHCPCHTPRPPSAVLRPHRPPPPMRQARRALPPQGGTRGSLTAEYNMCAPGLINWCLEIEGTSPGPLGMLQQHCRPCGHSYKHFVGTAGRYRGRYHPAIPKTTHTEATGIWPHTAKRMQPGAWLLSMTSLNTPGHPVMPFGM